MDINDEIYEKFKDKAPQKTLEIITKAVFFEEKLNNCSFYRDIKSQDYKDKLFKIIDNHLNFIKRNSEKKLLVARCFYTQCNDKDILDKIYSN